MNSAILGKGPSKQLNQWVMRCMKHTDSLNNSPVSSSSGGIPPGSILSDSRPPDRNPTYISIGVNESDLRSSKALYFGVPLVALSV